MTRALTTAERAYNMLTSEDDGRACLDIPEAACKNRQSNFLKHVAALSLTKSGDGLVDPKLVLSWLLTSLGVPAYIIGWLVPVREAGALLPQLFTAAFLRSRPVRKFYWAAGSALQGLSVAMIMLAALRYEGVTAGWIILGALTVFSLARSVCSVTYKDVLGKTVAKSKRGTATGLAGSIAAVSVLAYGAALFILGVDREALVIFGLGLAACVWVGAALIFLTLKEDKGATKGGKNMIGLIGEQFGLLAQDSQLRRFILTRALLVSTALAPPFMVAIAAENGDVALSKLGLLVMASAAASFVSSYVWGRLADRSSRKVLIFSALAASIALALTLAANHYGLMGQIWVLPLCLFALMIAYQGVRLGRSTHLVDMASADNRAAYTALSNSLIGLVLLFGGGLGVIGSAFGNGAVILILALLSLLAVPTALSLKEVQAS